MQYLHRISLLCLFLVFFPLKLTFFQSSLSDPCTQMLTKSAALTLQAVRECDALFVVESPPTLLRAVAQHIRLAITATGTAGQVALLIGTPTTVSALSAYMPRDAPPIKDFTEVSHSRSTPELRASAYASTCIAWVDPKRLVFDLVGGQLPPSRIGLFVVLDAEVFAGGRSAQRDLRALSFAASMIRERAPSAAIKAFTFEPGNLVYSGNASRIARALALSAVLVVPAAYPSPLAKDLVAHVPGGRIEVDVVQDDDIELEKVLKVLVSGTDADLMANVLPGSPATALPDLSVAPEAGIASWLVETLGPDWSKSATLCTMAVQSCLARRALASLPLRGEAWVAVRLARGHVLGLQAVQGRGGQCNPFGINMTLLLGDVHPDVLPSAHVHLLCDARPGLRAGDVISAALDAVISGTSFRVPLSLQRAANALAELSPRTLPRRRIAVIVPHNPTSDERRALSLLVGGRSDAARMLTWSAAGSPGAWPAPWSDMINAAGQGVLGPPVDVIKAWQMESQSDDEEDGEPTLRLTAPSAPLRTPQVSVTLTQLLCPPVAGRALFTDEPAPDVPAIDSRLRPPAGLYMLGATEARCVLPAIDPDVVINVGCDLGLSVGAVVAERVSAAYGRLVAAVSSADGEVPLDMPFVPDAAALVLGAAGWKEGVKITERENSFEISVIEGTPPPSMVIPHSTIVTAVFSAVTVLNIGQVQPHPGTMSPSYQAIVSQSISYIPPPSVVLRASLLRGAPAPPAQPPVLVDNREFRADLPMLLHEAGLRVVPAQLAVSDYCLSREIGIERKAVPDLVQSLTSGRLRTQAVELASAFSRPMLLIEGDPRVTSLGPGARFIGITEGLAPGRTSKTHVRLIMLLRYEPRLRVMWAPTPRHAAELMRGLAPAGSSTLSDRSTGVLISKSDRTSDLMLFASGLGGVGSELVSLLLERIPSKQALLSKRRELRECGIRTVRDLLTAPLGVLRDALGSESAAAVWNILNTQMNGANR